MNKKDYKNHVKYLQRAIEKAFNISENLKEYENLCECIYFSDCKLSYNEFARIKKLAF